MKSSHHFSQIFQWGVIAVVIAAVISYRNFDQHYAAIY